MLISRSSTLRIIFRGGVAASSIAKRVLWMEMLHSLLHSEPKVKNKISIMGNRTDYVTEHSSFIVNGHYHLWQSLQLAGLGTIYICLLISLVIYFYQLTVNFNTNFIYHYVPQYLFIRSIIYTLVVPDEVVHI
jgi:hypothetical protein